MVDKRTTPVVDLSMVLTGCPEPQATRWVSVRAGGRSVALAVAKVLDLVALAPAAFSESPPLLAGAAHGAVTSLGILDRDLIAVLDTARVVPETVWSALETHRASVTRPPHPLEEVSCT